MIRVLIAIILFVYFPSLLQAQTGYEFQHVSLEYNLPQNSLNVIYQDRTGFLWLGTKTGLDLFDGYKFISYKRENKPNTISDSFIKAIFEDSYGELWIGTRGGLNKFDRNEQTFLRFINRQDDPNSIANNFINAIVEDKSGNLWIGTDKGLSRFIRSQNKFVNYYHSSNDPNSISNDTVRVLYLDPSGLLFLGLSGGVIDCINLNESFLQNSLKENDKLAITRIFISDPGKNAFWVNKIIKDRNNNFWVATEGKGLVSFRINPEQIRNKKNINLEVKNYINNKNDPQSLSNNIVRDIIEDINGNLWICTYGGGINIFYENGAKFERIQYNSKDEKSLSNNYTLSIFQDRSRNIWIGGTTGGLNKYISKNFHFDIYKSDPLNPASLKNDIVTSIYVDDDGLLWVGTRDGGLNMLDRKKKICINYTRDETQSVTLSSNNVRSLCEDNDDRIWIGTVKGLSCFDRIKKKFLPVNQDLLKSLEFSAIRVIYYDKKNILWIGALSGLVRYNLNDNTFKKYISDDKNLHTLPANYIWSIYKDRHGNLWVGTSKGLCRYIEKKDAFKRYVVKNDRIKSDSVYFMDENLIDSMCEDLLDILWLSTMKGGIHKIVKNINYNPNNPDDDPYVLIEHSFPIIDYEGVNGTMVDDKNNLWIGSDIGIIKLDADRERWRLFDMKDGVTANEFITGAYYKSKEGEFFYGGNAGMNSFFPKDFKENSAIPNIVLTSLSINNEEQYSGTRAANLKEIEISFTKRIINFKFSVLDFTDIRKNQYQYKLEGFDHDWIHSGNKNEVTYMNLKGGTYIFRVIGSNNDGFWNKQGLSLKIIVIPPLWERTWFIPSIIAILLALIYLVFRNRVKQIQKQKIILEEQIRNRTEDLSQANKMLEQEVIERKHIELDILKTNTLLQESNASKDKLFSIISHDLRGPVGNLAGMLKVYSEEKDMDPEFRKEFLTSMVDSAESTYSLLENLLDWARTQRDSINLRFENIQICYIIEEVIGFLSGIASKKSISIISNIDESITAYCDRNTVSTIIRNLISNALKFTPEKGKIELSAREEEFRIIISVRDYGIGIKEEILDNIFKHRGIISTRGTGGEKGTGLGLLLCLEFVRKNGGEMWAESEIGKGTVFYFSLSKSKKDGLL